MARGNTTFIAEMPRAQEGENPPSLIFDAVINFTPSSTARITKYAISDKSEISNHRVRENPTLQLIACMGRAPLHNFDNNLVGVENPEERPKQALKILQGWDENSTELYIGSEYDTYSGYVITKLQQVSEGGDSLKFSLSLEKARRVSYSKGILVQNLDPTKSLDAKGNTGSGTADAKKSENEFIFDDVLSNYAKDFKGDVTSVEINNGD